MDLFYSPVLPAGLASLLVPTATWDASTGMFSPTGTPEGWNGRDANGTFVLRALQPTVDTSLNYELLFANGIVQTFNGSLQSVSDSSTGLTQSVYGGTLPSALRFGQQDVYDNPRYDMTVNWSNGNIASVNYQTQDNETGGAQTISTNLSYNDEDVSSMEKSDADQNIADLSYSSVSAGSITLNGVTTTRSGSMDAGSVTIATALPDDIGMAGGSSTSEVYTFNEHDLITSDALTLDEGNGTKPTTSTTSYEYQEQDGLYTNGEPQWAKVTLVTNPDGSWTGYTYDESTGWTTGTVTPFQSSTWSPGDGTSSDNFESYGYDPSKSGNGQAPDPSLLVQPPDTVTDFALGTQTGETFNNYQNPGYGSPKIITRQALSNSNPTWANALPFSNTTISAYDSSNTTSVTGNLSDNESGPGNYSITDSWLGNTTSQSSSSADAFGDPTSTSDQSLGQASGNDTAGTTFSFGRPLTQSVAGGQSVTNSYTNDDGSMSFFGPAKVTGPDGGVTNFTYTPLGQVATKVIYAGSSESVEYDYVYDAAGNVVKLTQSPVNASGALNGNPLVTAYDYDAQGRLTKEVDNVLGSDITANRTTSTVYTNDGTYNIASTTNPDNSTSITKGYLDGTTASIGGTAQTPATYTEGVVTSTAPDSQGRVVTAGSTWVMSSTNGGQDWTKTFTNVLGEVYLVQQSDPGSGGQPGKYVDSFTSFDANGRPTKNVDFTGAVARTVYNPWTGAVGATWVDVVGDGNFDPGIDSKTLYTASFGQTDTKILSTAGVQDDTTTYSNGGLTTIDNSDGLVTTSQTFYSANGYTNLITNPDGTQRQEIYTDGLLTEEDQLDNAEGLIAKTMYAYSGMRELASQTDKTGTTTFTYFEDGTQQSVTAPGQNPVTTNTVNSGTEDPTKVTNSDGTTTSQTEDSLGQTVTQSGAGVIAAKYGYNTVGQLTSLTTYPGGDPTNTDDPGAATTTWNYDNATGLLTAEHFADGTQDTYKYNAAGQMISLSKPGMTGTFSFDDYGNVTDSTYVDSTTGLVKSTVLQRDDLGRPVVTANTDNGESFTTTDAYTSLGDLQSETFGSAGNTSVGYAYYPVSSTGTPNPNASPDALQSMTVGTPGGTSTQQIYAYDPTTKRLASITVNGVVISYGYQTDSNQIASITAQPAGSNGLNLGVTTTFSPDSADGSRLGEISVDTTTDAGHGNTNQQTVYDGSYTYNSNGQRATDIVTQTDSDGNSSTQSLNYTYNPNQADALTQVKDANGNVLYGYSYDGVGNRSGTGYGSANSVNEYSNITYNQRGDETDDGSEHFTWDALDHLIGETPDHPIQGSTEEQMGYDIQGRMLWQTVQTYDASTSSYQLTYAHKFVWSGQDLVAELDANNTLIENFTWGPGVAGSDTLLAITDDTLSTPKTEEAIEDASGSVEELVNPLTGQVDASYSYGPFGENFTASGPEASLSPFGFQLMMRDASGKWYDHARWYDANQGRFISEDPTAQSGGLNLQAADNNDPINNIDQAGTRFESLKSLASTLVQAGMFVSGVGQAQVIDAHSAELGAATISAGKWVKHAFINEVTHHSDFENGQTIGIVNGAAKIVTSVPKLAGQAQAYTDTLGPQIADSLAGRPDQNESAYAIYGQVDAKAQFLQLPDKLREQAKNHVINTLVNAGGNRQAIEDGAVVGEIGLNVALVGASLVDPLLSLNDIDLAADGAALLDGSTAVSLNGVENGGVGGLTKIGPDLAGNPFLENAANIPAEPGYFDLVGHSHNAGTQLLGGVDEGGPFSLGLDEIEEHLVANGWQGEPIRLISCSAGDPTLGANAIAAKISIQLKVPVMAPASDITVFGDGTFSIQPSDGPFGVPYGTPSIDDSWTFYGQK